VLDLARENGWRAGVVAADAGLNRQLLTVDDLRRQASAMTGWPYSRRARAVLDSCDGDSESPLESLSRLAIAAHDLPLPRLQVSLGNLAGDFVGRVDFYWAEFGVVGEADGQLKYTTGPVLIAEKQRQERLERIGLIVVRWDWSDLTAFHRVADRLRAAFSRSNRGTRAERWLEIPRFVRETRAG